jgi:hypothetical protein
MNATMWEHGTFDSQIFGCGKVYYSNSIIITNFVQNIVHNSCLKLTLKSKKCFIWYLEILSNTRSSSL